MCTACKMNHGHKRLGDSSDRYAELERRVAAKAGHPAGLQAQAGAAPIVDDKTDEPLVRADKRIVAEEPPEPKYTIEAKLPEHNYPGSKGPQGWDVKHIHITDNVWREPATWLAAALALSAVATVTTAFIYTRAKG